MNWTIVRSFGFTSAAGGITGALLNTRVASGTLDIVFGLLLVFAGISQVTGFAARWRLPGAFAWLGGGASGFFGGLVGNQGGIRTAALLGFDVHKRQFVATATAVALLVDAARVPVFLVFQARALWMLLPVIAVSSLGVILGTFMGERMLARVPDRQFRGVVGILLVMLGLSFLVSAAV